MAILHTFRHSESPFVHAITKSVALTNGVNIIFPDALWDMMFVKHDGKLQAFLMNTPPSQAVEVPHFAGQESLVISFRIGSYLSSYLDKKGFFSLPVIGKHSFKLGNEILDVPTFEDAEDFVNQLVKRNLLKHDVVVESIAAGKNRAQTARTAQRHFRWITGMTPHYYKQIKRALKAVELLRSGKPAIVVAYDLGYSDQFHMSKSLKNILGKSPSEIDELFV